MIRCVPTLLSALFSALILIGCTVAADQPEEPPLVAEKRIALTYDDAPRGDGRVFSGIDRTAALIEQLDLAETGPVAIFVTTRGFAQPGGRDRIQRYAEAGHRIANHSQSHMWASQTDAAAYIADIDEAEAALTGFANRRAWFRFPYLDEGGRGEAETAAPKRDALRDALADRELMSGYVTVDTYDWYLESLWQAALRDEQTVDRDALTQLYIDLVLDAADHYDRLGLAVLDRRPAQVVLLHENDLAASFTAQLVAALRADGWSIIDPDDAFADPIATQLPDTRFSGMGRIAALAMDAGLRGSETFDHWSVSEADIDARVAAANIFTD